MSIAHWWVERRLVTLIFQSAGSRPSFWAAFTWRRMLAASSVTVRVTSYWLP